MRTHYPLNSAGAEDAGQLPWTDGVPSTGVQGSFPGHAIVTDAEAEILNAQGLAGLVQSGTDTTQLAQAISRGIYLGGYTGSANALTATLPANISMPSLLVGMRFSGVVTTPNTGSVTVALSGFAAPPGALSLLRGDGQPLVAGDLPLNRPFDIRFDGSAFRVTAPVQSEIAASTSIVIQSRRIAGSTPFRYGTAGASTLFVAAGTIFNIAECRGSGGGGGGANGTNAAGSGGGGGGNSVKVCQALLDTVLLITVGASGSPGAAGGGNAGSGGTTSVAVQSGKVQDGSGATYTAGQTLCAATGGTGGYGGVGGNQGSQQGLGGVASGGDLNDNGDPGGYPPQVGSYSFGGSGGASPGSGGRPDPNYAAQGNSSSAPGTGGSGASANAPGAPGTTGRVTIYK